MLNEPKPRERVLQVFDEATFKDEMEKALELGCPNKDSVALYCAIIGILRKHDPENDIVITSTLALPKP